MVGSWWGRRSGYGHSGHNSLPTCEHCGKTNHWPSTCCGKYGKLDDVACAAMIDFTPAPLTFTLSMT